MNFLKSVSIMLFVAGLVACGRSATVKPASQNDADGASVAVPDTGYTGIKQFTSGKYLISEVNFVNGIREGITKTFYQSGRLQRTYWYEKGLRQDSSCWFYEEGQLFRLTPFKNDTVEGIQKQYYRTGELKANMGYHNGLRTAFFEEYTRDGKLVKDYPEIVIRSEDTYNKDGRYRIILELSDKKVNVNWLRGEFTNGAYDTSRVVKIGKKGNTGILELRKTGKEAQSNISIIAEILTNFGNRMLVTKRIDLPYRDLK